jgi:hypothetical protein
MAKDTKEPRIGRAPAQYGCGNAEGLHLLSVPSRGAKASRNAFVSRRTYGKLALRISAMDPVAFGAACDFGIRYTAQPPRSGRREVGRLTRFGSTS